MSLLVIAPLGLLVGLVVGSLGGGGAILTVPILVYVLGQSPSAATTGSLVIVILSSLAGLIPHARAGRVRWRQGLVFGALGVIGSLVGSRLNAAVPPHVLMTAFAVLLLAVAGLMTRRRRAQDRRRRDGTPEPADGRPAGRLALVATATGVGFLTGFFGVGGGFAVVPALVLALGFAMPAAVGTSLVVIVVNGLTALGARIGVGLDLDWPLILTFSAFAAAGSMTGGRLAQKVDPRLLNLAFTILLVLIAIYVAWQNVPAFFG